MKKLFASLIGISLVLSGCSLGPRDEKQAFIDATVEATCHIFQADNLFDPVVEQEAKDIYKKYGFDADDQEGMQAIADKYAKDEDVKNTIMDQIKECSDGVPGLEDLGSMVKNGDTEPTLDKKTPAKDAAEPVEGDAVKETTPATEEPVAEKAAPAVETPAVEDEGTTKDVVDPSAK